MHTSSLSSSVLAVVALGHRHLGKQYPCDAPPPLAATAGASAGASAGVAAAAGAAAASSSGLRRSASVYPARGMRAVAAM